MTITFLIQDITTNGGTERTTLCLAREMVRHGHSVAIISLFRQLQHLSYDIPNDVRLVFATDLAYNLQIGLRKRLIYIYRARKSLMQLPEWKSADVIICQKLLASVTAFLSNAHHHAIACEHFRYEMYTPIIRYLRTKLYRHFRTLVVLTEQDAKHFRSKIPCVQVIPNMISIRPLPYRGQKSKTIISIGRLTDQKGFDRLLRAIHHIDSRLGDYHVDIYGEGENEQALILQRDTLQLQHRVTFHPFERHIEHIYQHAAFYVMSSRFEGFPMVLLEAAAAGLPIVSFDCPEGPATLLQNGGGILVTDGDINNLGNAILRMIQDDDFRSLCQRQSPEIVKPYLPETIYQHWNNLLEAIHQINA